MHYQRFMSHGDPMVATLRSTRPSCSVPDCQEPHTAKGYCAKHYNRWKKYGDPLISRRSSPLAKQGEPLQWLLDHVSYEGPGCLTWPFAVFPNGYGIFSEGGAHRTMCTLANGDPPTPLHYAAHDCGNGQDACVHPKHLYWATPQENTMDRYRHGTMLFGERGTSAKLTALQVHEIRSLKGKESQRKLAQRYGVSKSLVGAIHRDEIWRLV
ncbi:hypothetical protein [Ensifer sp. LCM 4579]|uniref:hypothetical protein n=1 Tax=Ensifer sp. LCM 4579 TaxID=1848292 RepID=UPI00155E87CD|nr:hypothetical protein [Ensifer sp. LCM 4579]